jgi:hypothetical protein
MASGQHVFRLPGGRVIKTSAVFDTYWRFASMRQDVFMKRVTGQPPPWTDDQVLAAHRFTNVYRASDRVSQYLIHNVLYAGSDDAGEVFLRCLLFKIFNKIETWEYLVSQVGTPTLHDFDLRRYGEVLERRIATAPIYSAAYIMPSPPFGHPRKHVNHLELVKKMIGDRTWARMIDAGSLEKAFKILLGYPSLGDFLAFQFTIDLNYGPAMSYDEADFVVAGPGARDGIRKCFRDTAGLSEADVIRAMAETASSQFERLGLEFRSLWGRPLQPIDCQNVFCEVDKYARVVHPGVAGHSGRTRIKQKYVPTTQPVPQWYPPKWGLRTEPSTSIPRTTFPSQQSFYFASSGEGTKRTVPA